MIFFFQIKSSPENSEELKVHCDYLVNAAGPWAGEVALRAGIGRKDHNHEIMRTKLPVEPRLRSVFVFKCPNGPSNCPLVTDGHIYWRSEQNGMYLTGYSPSEVRVHAYTLQFHVCVHLQHTEAPR